MPNPLLPAIETLRKSLTVDSISTERKAILQELVTYIQMKRDNQQEINLNFICTHNSRRSQLSQVWAQVAAWYYDIPIKSMSGGVEVTAFNERAVQSLERAGFQIHNPGGANPQYQVQFSFDSTPLICFSKLFDDPANEAEYFAAVMTCSHADENCPFIPGTEQRIAVRYEDPKAFDDTPEESSKYDERSAQIATEMFYVFSQV